MPSFLESLGVLGAEHQIIFVDRALRRPRMSRARMARLAGGCLVGPRPSARTDGYGDWMIRPDRSSGPKYGSRSAAVKFVLMLWVGGVRGAALGLGVACELFAAHGFFAGLAAHGFFAAQGLAV